MNMEWLLNRLKEPSTFRAITVVLTLVGVNLNPEHIESILTVGGLFYALILGIKKDANSPDA